MPGVRVLMCRTFPFSRTTSMSSPISGPTLERRNGRNDLGTRPRTRNGRKEWRTLLILGLTRKWRVSRRSTGPYSPRYHLSSDFELCFPVLFWPPYCKWRAPTSVLEELLGNMRVHCDGHDIMVFDVGELDDQVPLQGLEVKGLHGLTWPLLDPEDRG